MININKIVVRIIIKDTFLSLIKTVLCMLIKARVAFDARVANMTEGTKYISAVKRKKNANIFLSCSLTFAI